MKKFFKKIQNALDTFNYCLDTPTKAQIICIPLMLIIIILSIFVLLHDAKTKEVLQDEERVTLDIPVLPTHEPLPDYRENELCEYWKVNSRGDIECKVMTEQEYLQEDCNQKAEQKAALMNMLLSTDKGKTFLHYSVILAGMVLAFLAFIFFLITWRATKRLMRPKTVRETIKQICEIPEDVLRKSEVLPYYTTDYLETLKDKYQYYGDEYGKDFVLWVYRRITQSDDFKFNDRKHIIDQLKWGNIVNLNDYDWFVRNYKKRNLTDDEYKDIINKLEHQDIFECEDYNSEEIHKEPVRFQIVDDGEEKITKE